MTDHKVVSRQEWQATRDELLRREKEHTRMADGAVYQTWIRRHDEYV